jgi:hypothetical protein
MTLALSSSMFDMHGSGSSSNNNARSETTNPLIDEDNQADNFKIESKFFLFTLHY